jgi:ribosome biogenesis protein Tsr3
MMVAAIDKCDPHRCVRQTLGRSNPTKATTDDHHVHPVVHHAHSIPHSEPEPTFGGIR